MRFRSIATRRLFRWTPLLLVLLVLAVAGCAENYPQTSLAPKGDFAQMVDHVFRLTVRWAALVFLLVEGALIVAIIRFRGKPDDPEPKQIHGSTVLEVIWTIIPAIILVLVAIPTIKTVFATAKDPGNEALVVEVVGHQWWWEFRYPDLGLTTANELHVPLGRTIDLRLESADVVHSFWIPQFAGKRDVFPKRETRIWFKTEDAGSYPGQCAEFCGIQHGRMGFRVIADEVADFDAWVAGMRATTATVPVEDSLALVGQQLFATKACVGCHSLNAVNPPPGQIGPNLANIGARTMIAAGMLKNTDANLARWIQDPQGYKKGSLMKIPGRITDDEARALVAYLRTQRITSPAVVAADTP